MINTENLKNISGLLYVDVVMQALAAIGIAIKIFFTGQPTADGMDGPASSTIWGYGLVLVAIFGLFFTQYALYNQKPLQFTQNKDDLTSKNNDPTQAKNQNEKPNLINLAKGSFDIIVNSLPTLAIIITLSWLIILNTKYFKRINQGKVASEYSQFSTSSTIMIVLQLVLLSKKINELKNKAMSSSNKSDELNNEMERDNAISYLLGLLSIIFVMMQNIILTYFTTDA